MAQKPVGGSDASAAPATTDARGSAADSSKKSSSSAAASSVLPKMSDPSPPQAVPGSATDQVAKSTANTAKDATAAPSTTASPYGTRSRNRGGNSRPNYAEDKDMDMDIFEQLHPQKRDDDGGKKATRQVASSPVNTGDSHDTPPPTRATTGSSRKPLPTDNKQAQAAKESSSSNQTTAAGASGGAQTTTSKKRKAATQSNQQPAEPAHVPATTSNAKKSSNHQHSNPPLGPDKGYAATNLLTFEKSGARPKDGKLIADDGTVLEVNDHVYLVCEPPGEPYYLARIMEFLHAKNDPSQPVDALRVNWYYRPKDIARKVNDTRAVFATMHSDISPLTSLRGKCTIKHKAEIQGKLEDYRKNPDCFWFEKLYDRYIQKNYEVIPTFQIINVPEKVKKVLDERWKYILVEQGRGKELTSAVKTCRRCSGYCASNDSVDCAVCDYTYHMNCVRPPLLKKPSRGFAWSCAACSRAQERKLEARNTPNVGSLDTTVEADEEEFLDEEEEDAAAVDTGRTSPADGSDEMHIPATEEQMYHASLWPYRYLGIHCKVEDALDYDDRIYPRAATRVGPRHQATVLDWPGRPVEYVKAPEIEIKKTGRKDGKLNKEAQAALEAEKAAKAKRPKWIQDEPPGYVPRGEDYPNDDPRNTARAVWIPPEVAKTGKQLSEEAIDKYMAQAKAMALKLDLPEHSTNLLDVALDVLYTCGYDTAKALKELPKLDKSVFKEPQLTPAEVKKFEEGIAKFGSELHSVKKHVKTVDPGTIVRFYYTWKKTPRGKQIWGNYSGRKSKKEAKKVEPQTKVQDDVADDHDDSAFDADKATEKKRQFTCKFCNTKKSRQWRRAPNASGALVTEGKGANKDKGVQYIVALCRRCAELWRRYAIQWEDVDQLYSKVAQAGGRAWKKKIDEELLKEIVLAEQRSRNTPYSNGTETPPGNASPAPAAAQPSVTAPAQEPARKKLKTQQQQQPPPPPPQDKDVEMTGTEPSSASGTNAAPKKKDKTAAAAAAAAADKVKEEPAPTPVPEIPKPRTMPCDICHQIEPLGDQHLSCKECRLTVHRNCYGVVDNRNPGKWVCDMCINDRSPHVSIHYKCVLCPVEYTEHDFVEPPKPSHKKKSEKDRERERQEREAAISAAEYYRKRQEDLNRPVNPREPLKRTADNNWVHVTCAVWTPEVKFGNAKALEPSEGITSIPRSRYTEVCKVCKTTAGACIYCHHCKAPVHVECAHQAGYILGFDITPIKGSRRDQHNIVTIGGESGSMSASVWCREHVPLKTMVHQMHDMVDEAGTNVLQLYAQNFKKADLTLTGCARKANLISTAARMSNPAMVATTAVNRRSSTTTLPPLSSSAVHIHNLLNGDGPENPHDPMLPGGKICITCGVDVSPRWYPISEAQERELTNGHFGSLGKEAKKFAEQRNFQCHKCKKLDRQPKPHAPSPAAPSPRPHTSHTNNNNTNVNINNHNHNSAQQASLATEVPVSKTTGMGSSSTGDTMVTAPALTNGSADHSLNGGVRPPKPDVIESMRRSTPPLTTSPRVPQGHDVILPRPGQQFGWQSGLQAPHQAGIIPSPHGGPLPVHGSGPPPPPPSMQASALQPPPIAPPPMIRSMSGRGPASVPPGGPVAPSQAYQAGPPSAPPPPPPPPPTVSGPYGDWHRTTHHGPAINGGPPTSHSSRISPSIPPLAPPTLRPPPLHHSPPHASHVHLTNGHMVNGAGPSARRMSGPLPPSSRDGPSPYMGGYHSSPGYHSGPSHHANGTMVPPRIDHALSVLNPSRAYGVSGVQPPPHISPPMPREAPLSREGPAPPQPQQQQPPPPPPARPSETRPASGASASPSLRNLLS